VLEEVHNKYKDKNFTVLGVAVWDRIEKTKEFLEKHNTAWPQIINAGMLPMGLYGISGIPHIILFGPDGTILARGLRGDGLKLKVDEVMNK